MVKINLQKAYDSVEWVYLEQVLKKLCFPTKFINWILQCVRTVSYSVVINGQPNTPFNAAKGLRQVDPISPYLFAVAIEYLSRLLSTMKDHKDYSYHPRCAKLGYHICALQMICFCLLEVIYSL